MMFAVGLLITIMYELYTELGHNFFVFHLERKLLHKQLLSLQVVYYTVRTPGVLC